MTPAELVEELHRLGLTDVDERLLTDWRQKALLPKLADEGRGRAAGKDYFWTEPNIVERAIFVHKMLAVPLPAEAVLVAVWLKGYGVPIEELRSAWLGRFAKIENQIERRVGPRDGEDRAERRDDVHAKIGEDVSRRIAKSVGIQRSKIEPGVHEAVVAALDPAFSLNQEAIDTISDAVVKFLESRKFPPGHLYQARKLDYRWVVDLLKDTLSPEAAKQLIGSATVLEFEQAQTFWVAIWEVVLAVFPILERNIPGRDFTRSTAFGFAFGRHFVSALIFLIRKGRAREIERSLSAVKASLAQHDLSQSIIDFAEGGKISGPLGGLVSELETIWSEFRRDAA